MLLAFQLLTELAALIQYQLMAHAHLGGFQLGTPTCFPLTIQFSQSSVTFGCIYNLHAVPAAVYSRAANNRFESIQQSK